MNQYIAVIRISGKIGVKKKIRDTLNMIKLYKKYHCVILPNTNSSYLGMIKKVKDYVTWGEIDKETLKLLLEKRGRLPNKQSLTNEYLQGKLNISIAQFAEEIFDFKKQLKDLPGLKLFFKLSPPRGGFERKGTKHHFSMGGVLGYRKEKINDLIKKML